MGAVYPAAERTPGISLSSDLHLLSGQPRAGKTERTRLNNSQVFANFFEDCERAGEFLLGVRRRDDGADTRFTLGNSGEADALGEDACREELAGEFVGQRRITDDDRRDGRLAHAGVETEALEARFEELGVGPESFDELGLLVEDFEGGQAGGGHRWRVRRGKEERPGAVVKEVDSVAR